MARTNVEVQLSPIQASPEEDPVDEDELEAGPDDERTAKLLTASLGSSKKPSSKDTSSTGVMKTIGRWIGIGSQSQINTEAMFYPTKNPNSGNNRQAEADAEREEEADVTGNFTTHPNHRKRDVYDFEHAHPDALDEGGYIEESVRKRATLRRTARKATPSQMSPKRDKRPIEIHRQTRANTKVASKEPDIETNPPKSSPAGTNGAGISSEPPKKRGRGRPPKNQRAPPEASSDLPDLQDIGQPRTPSVEYPGDDAQLLGVAENSDTDLYMNPSPVKPLPVDLPRTQRLKPAKQPQNHQARPVNGGTASRRLKSACRLQNQPASGGISDKVGEVSDSVDEDGDDEQGPADGPAPDVSEEDDDDDHTDKSPITLGDIIAIATLEKMLETARRVGHKQNKETEQWEHRRTEENPSSRPGKRLLRRLEQLIEGYGDLQTAREAGSNADAIQLKITDLVQSLKAEFEVVFSERLGNPAHGIPYADTESTHIMLTDIYFILVPKLVEALKGAVEVSQDEEFSETDALEEIFSLVDLLRQLAERAIQQPPASQPKASKKNQYRISLQTKLILPAIRIIHKDLSIEIQTRKHAEKLDAWNSRAADREHKRAELEEREHAEQLRQRREIYRMQREVINAKLRHPKYGPYLQAEFDRDAAKAQERRMQMQVSRTAQSRQRNHSERMSVEELDDDDDGERIEDDPFDDQYERIRVFPNNNANKYQGPKPLLRDEKLILINTMQRENKEIRYEKAAKQLGRSLEEIFAYAKELQEAFDLAHERGEMNLPCDEWTYDVFIEQP